MANTESIVYKGEKYWVQSSGRYFASADPVNGERLLHRRVWVDANGPIPPELEIHHKDRDWRNNALENLELMEIGEHHRMHMLERRADPIERARLDEWLERARVAAAVWHGSPEGLEWHSQHGREVWECREPVDAVCERCGEVFPTYFPTRARYCSSACGQSVLFRTYFTDTRLCAWCGAEFKANRHRTTACCSRTCSNRKRGAEIRGLICA